MAQICMCDIVPALGLSCGILGSRKPIQRRLDHKPAMSVVSSGLQRLQEGDKLGFGNEVTDTDLCGPVLLIPLQTNPLELDRFDDLNP